tara:strand:- start:585 stop:1028 length:444 start_codon:yes stop_codon:yes gene_type:complete
MPPPLQSDAFIRRICPTSHPPPLGKIYNITSVKEPKYKQMLPGIKVAAPYVISPVYMDTMARALVSDRGNNARAIVMARERVLAEYSKPAPDINALLSQTKNLRGSSNMTPREISSGLEQEQAPTMLGNMAKALKEGGRSSYDKSEL